MSGNFVGLVTAVWVEQLSVSPGGNSLNTSLGSTHASLSSERPPSAVMNTSILIVTSCSGLRSPTQSTTLIGFCSTWHAQLLPEPVSMASGISPTGSGSCIFTPVASCPSAGLPPGALFFTTMLYVVVWLWLDVVGPFFVSDRLIRGWMFVVAVDVLLVSLPSGIVLSGSTIALFK